MVSQQNILKTHKLQCDRSRNNASGLCFTGWLQESIRPVFMTGLNGKQESGNDGLPDRNAARFLRRIRRVLAPNGSNSNAPAIIVVGSGTLLMNSQLKGAAPIPLLKPGCPLVGVCKAMPFAPSVIF